MASRKRRSRRLVRAIRAHPGRAVLLAGLGVVLIGLVVTKSLPYALASVAPELALKLDPSNAKALITLAERERDQLLALKRVEESQEAPGASSSRPSQHPATEATEPAADETTDAQAEEVEALTAQIRSLAKRAIVSSPLNATAYRLLGELAGKPEDARALMQAAVDRSRRETIALFWLMNDAFVREDYKTVIDHADTLLRSRPQLAAYVMRYLGEVAADDEGRKFLVARLMDKPRWLGAFFAWLPRSVKDGRTPLRVMLDLKQVGQDVSNKDLQPYLDFMISKGLVDAAYNAWLQMQPVASLEKLGLVTNAGFEQEPSGLPFDWRIAKGLNAVAEIAPVGGGRALHIAFGVGHVKFPVVSQILVMPAGHYRLEGTMRGELKAKRGLRWEIGCLKGAQIGGTDMLWGAGAKWTTFASDFSVPEGENCHGQQLRLVHQARSRSEEFVAGEIWFDSLQLVRATD